MSSKASAKRALGSHCAMPGAHTERNVLGEACDVPLDGLGDRQGGRRHLGGGRKRPGHISPHPLFRGPFPEILIAAVSAVVGRA